ncbi:LysE/ArgO family amino acid transporter [Hirschia baltica]|uniref:Lysine exporter protein (LYSE/YGGA) n=1 Tax=Hirschia baltica (strain ATCC 49814 / DSM 5838 / IFAM 1418) TaxID=582402 RepID=C6XMP8_HIRBI|nr:LysE/ArgO family amino acid transporter [Hirschia baltica]ACT59962.1 Lysine exporter protein (LYSE/YGGA) [Hirschia baltica ATCC 49814]
MSAMLTGFSLSLSLIIGLGAQNAFILRQGMRREHVLPVVLVCAISDAILLIAGAVGFGLLVKQSPNIVEIFRYVGVGFLIVYGSMKFHSAWQGSDGMDLSEKTPTLLLPTVLTAIALTWLNPHVYLETVMLMGSLASQSEDKLSFTIGAIMSSFFFFFSFGYGARLLTPLFVKPISWRYLDFGVGVLMWIIAAKVWFH